MLAGFAAPVELAASDVRVIDHEAAVGLIDPLFTDAPISRASLNTEGRPVRKLITETEGRAMVQRVGDGPDSYMLPAHTWGEYGDAAD